MPLKGLEPRLRQLGRIRLGQKGDRGQPQRLTTWRLTSSNRQVLIDAASLYGGTPQPWQGAPSEGQWELVTERDTLEIVLPPDRALSQSYELWNAGGCIRRCDGDREQLTDQPCLCALEEARVCKPTTRLNVLLPNLPGLGVWRLDTHGVYAATELAGVVELVGRLRAFVNATLRIEQRTEKKITDGKSETRHFPVPVIDLDVTPGQIAGLTLTPSQPQAALVPSQQQPALEAPPAPRLDYDLEAAVAPELHTIKEPSGRDVLRELSLSANDAREALKSIAAAKADQFGEYDGITISACLSLRGEPLVKARRVWEAYQEAQKQPEAGS